MDDQDQKNLKKYKDFLQSPIKNISQLGYTNESITTAKNNIETFLKEIETKYGDKINGKQIPKKTNVNWNNIIKNTSYDYKDYTDTSYENWIKQLNNVKHIFTYKDPVWPSIEQPYIPNGFYQEVGYILKIEKMKIIAKVLKKFKQNNFQTLSSDNVIFLKKAIEKYNKNRKLWLKAMQETEDAPIQIFDRKYTINEIQSYVNDKTNFYLIIQTSTICRDCEDPVKYLSIKRDVTCKDNPLLCFVNVQNNSVVSDEKSNLVVIKELRETYKTIFTNFLIEINKTNVSFVSTLIETLQKMKFEYGTSDFKTKGNITKKLIPHKEKPLKIKIFTSAASIVSHK